MVKNVKSFSLSSQIRRSYKNSSVFTIELIKILILPKPAEWLI